MDENRWVQLLDRMAEDMGALTRSMDKLSTAFDGAQSRAIEDRADLRRVEAEVARQGQEQRLMALKVSVVASIATTVTFTVLAAFVKATLGQ